MNGEPCVDQVLQLGEIVVGVTLELLAIEGSVESICEQGEDEVPSSLLGVVELDAVMHQRCRRR